LHAEKGQTLIELAIALVLLLVVLFGITEFGRYFFYRNTFNNAARAGVRQAVVTTPLSATSEICPGSPGGIVGEVCKFIPAGLDPKPTVTVSVYEGTTTNDRGGDAENGDRIQVQTTWTFTIVTGSILPFFTGTRPIVGDASMRYELN
jgi:hypothetical protein